MISETGIRLKEYKVRDRTWIVRLYGKISPGFSEGIIDRTGAQTMLYLTCITISSVDLAQYGISLAKDRVSEECGKREF